MSNIIVPFNFEPISADVKFGSYTVPSDRYALVTPNGSWLKINSDTLGFEPVLYQDNTVNEPGFAADPQYRTIANNTGASLFCSTRYVSGSIGSGDYCLIGALAPGITPGTSQGNVNAYAGAKDTIFPGGNEYAHLFTPSTTIDPGFENNHVIEIPNKHTFQRVYRHFQPGDFAIDYYVYSNTLLSGNHWVEPSTALDGDQYHV